MRERERTNPLFSFLNVGDAYWAYYQMRVETIRAEMRAGVTKSRMEDAIVTMDEERETGRLRPSDGEEDKKRFKKSLGPSEPPAYAFSLPIPVISAQDLDIVRWTALYTARNGQAFTRALSERESHNSQFDFLKRGHSLHSVYQALVDAYQKVLVPTQELMQRLHQDTNKFSVLNRCTQRVEYERYVLKTRREEKKEEERRQAEFMGVDWHDFVVVQKIEFSGDDLAGNEMLLPPPTSVKAMMSIPLKQRKAMFETMIANQDEPEDMELFD